MFTHKTSYWETTYCYCRCQKILSKITHNSVTNMMNTHTHTCMHAHKHMHTRTHARTHARTHTHTHSHNTNIHIHNDNNLSFFLYNCLWCTDSDLQYLFDWSLPINCPDLVKELRIPKYFANDYLQGTLVGSLYQDSWPSLFIAPAGITSELHVDAFGSNFWMALFQGQKR